MTSNARAAVKERFAGQVGPYWRRYAFGYADLMLRDDGLQLAVAGAEASSLSVAQLDEGQLAIAGGRGWCPPLRLQVRARWSHSAADLIGTSGFGFWNDPWGAAGFSAPPAWVWFAHYSAPSHIALRPDAPGHGPRAAVMAAPRVGRLGLWLGNLALRLPGVARLAVGAAGRTVRSGDVPLAHDLRAWHDYELRWRTRAVTFAVDGRVVATVPAAPRGPLGFVAWMDNQWAALGADGAASGGYLAVPSRQWLQLSSVTISREAEDDGQCHQ